jgi:type II secretory pathway pseudopilin PulG
MQQGNFIPVRTKQRREGGSMLLGVMFMMTMMVLTLSVVAPAFIQQAKRDREEEMIHRGTEYARAIRRYYKKFGRYPASIEQLQNTNELHFLRKPYKDPLTKDGQWKLLHYADIQALMLGANPPGLQTGGTAGAGADQAGAAGLPQQSGGFVGGSSPGGAQPGGIGSPVANTGEGAADAQTGLSPGAGTGQSGGVGGTQGQGAVGQAGSNNTIFGNTGVGGQTFGGGGIVGVASKSNDPTIRIYNKKKTYDEWMFVYIPMMERQNLLLSGPYNGMTFPGMPVGLPPGQINQGQGSTQEAAPGVQLPPNQAPPQ